MQENMKKYLAKLKESRKLRRRQQLVMIAVGLLVIFGVFGILTMPGLGKEEKLVCEKTEHTHTDECQGYICGSEAHEHVADCMELACGSEEHEHSTDCKKYICESEEKAHEHTAECAFEYVCGSEEHAHSDSCNSIACGIDAHIHTEECSGYVCGNEEHAHDAGCYEQTKETTTEEVQEETVTEEQVTAEPVTEETTTVESSAIDLATSSEDEEEAVDEGLVISVSAEETEALAGQTLTVDVSSQYSGPNDGEAATVRINMGQLPDGVVLTGFVNGTYKIKTEETGQTVTIHLETEKELDEEGNEVGEISYIWFNQELGDTVHFQLTFETTNGIMDEESVITVAIDPEKTQIPEGVEGEVTIKDGKESATLTWTAENEWDEVDKTVNAESIAVNAENHFSGTLVYTIKANSLNNENLGEIWTEYLEVTDTLTLSDNIFFPEGVKVDGDKVVTADDKTILSFTELQGGEVVSLTVSEDRKSVTYELKIPNPNVDTEGLLTKEMDHLSLTMEMDAYQLELTEDFILEDKSVIETESIVNHVKLQPMPYKGEKDDPTEDEVITIPTVDPEKFELTKTADLASVKAGDEIEYTITLTNTGETPLAVKNGEEKYVVTDTLPEYLYLTAEQISALEAAGASCEVKTETEKVTDETTGEETEVETTTYTVSWVPSEEKIQKDETVKLVFKATVKDDDSVKALDNGDIITNRAAYKEKTADCPVSYREADITVEKTGAVVGGGTAVKNGGQIEYTLTIKNNTDVPAVIDEMVTDSLPKGLTFVSAKIGNTTLTGSGSDVVLHDNSDTHAQEHTIDFTINSLTNELYWNVGKLGANEEIKLTFICSVNTDELENGKSVENTVTLSSGNEDSCVIGVENPIKLDKKVKLSSEEDTEYADGDAEVHDNGTVFTYKIEVSNDADNPSRNEVVVVDQMPADMLPEGVTLVVNGTASDMTWESFVELTADQMAGNTYTAVVGGYEATVAIVDGAVELTWNLGVLDAGKTVTIIYQAKIANDEMTTGTLYTYTNTVTVGDISDSVTVRGGNNKGKLVLEKKFIYYKRNETTNQWTWSMMYSDNLEHPMYGIEFVIKGVDSEDNPIVFPDTGTEELVVTLKDFTWDWDTAKFSYENDNIPEGTYTIVEKNYDCDSDFICYPEFDKGSGSAGSVKWISDTASAEVEVINNATTIADVLNTYYTKDTVNLQKSVYEIGKAVKGSDSWDSIADKSQFYIDDETDTYVVYNISVSMDGGMDASGHYTKIASLKDKLPDELTYVGIGYASSRENGIAVYDINNFSNTARTNYFYLNNGVTNVEQNVTWARDVVITAEYDEGTNEVSFDIQFPDYYVNGNLTETYEKNEFPSKNLVCFLMLCKVDENVEEGQEITNTMELVVEDPVFYTEKERYQMYSSPYDANQNNGDTTLVSGGNGTDTTVLTSSVTIVPENTIVPGIEKEAVSYILQGSKTEQTLDEESSIVPNSAVKWEVTIHNDGTEPMKNYTLGDLVTAPFHFMTKEEASGFGITTPYKYEIYTFDGWHREIDISEQVYQTITNGSALNEYTFDFLGDYSIPSNGYAVLTMYTNNTVGSYKAYKNTATIYPDPTDDFSANLVQYGELIKDSNGKYVGVSASDTVYAFGEFATVSWKTIAETADMTNTVKGTDSKNYIFVEADSRDVTYTNNIKNISTKDFTDLVVIDVMPMKNDRGVINQKEKRGSEFRVLYTGNMTAKVVDASGSVVATPDFTIQFSESSSFSEKDFAGAETTKWHDECTDADCSFRVMFDEEFILEKGQTLILSYEGKVEDAAVPGAIAWNSFGYQYNCGSETLRAEPPKVGVMIPPVPIIQKEVVDSNGDVQEKDAGKVFTFILWDKANYDETATEEVNAANAKLCEFTLSQGGYLELTELTDEDGNCVLEEGKEYMITEDSTKMPEGYSLVGIGEYGGELSEAYTFTYDRSKTISILARNSVEQYVQELPATGAFSTLAYKVTGTLLVLLAGLLCGYQFIIRRKRRDL